MGETVSITGRKTAITHALPTKENSTALTKINVTGLPAEMDHVMTYHCTCSNVDWYVNVLCQLQNCSATLPRSFPYFEREKRGRERGRERVAVLKIPWELSCRVFLRKFYCTRLDTVSYIWIYITVRITNLSWCI